MKGSKKIKSACWDYSLMLEIIFLKFTIVLHLLKFSIVRKPFVTDTMKTKYGMCCINLPKLSWSQSWESQKIDI